MAKTSKRAVPTPKRTEPALPELPGTTLTWLLLAGAMLWFAGRLWAMRGTLLPAATVTGVDSETVSALVIFALPTIISAALLVGASFGMAAVLWRRAAGRSWQVRLRIGALAGLVAAAVTGGALAVSGADYPGSVLTAAISVAVSALIGGVIAGVRVPTLAAGLAGALSVAVLQFVLALFTSDLRGLLDGGGTGPEVADAERRLAMIVGVLAGVAAGIMSYAVLRRLRPVGLSHHVVAGAAAGAFLLVAEVISRIVLPLMVGAAGGRTGDDPLVLQLTGDARLNAGLLVFFGGAITAVIVLGRARGGSMKPSPVATRRPTAPAATGASRTAAGKPVPDKAAAGRAAAGKAGAGKANAEVAADKVAADTPAGKKASAGKRTRTAGKTSAKPASARKRGGRTTGS